MNTNHETSERLKKNILEAFRPQNVRSLTLMCSRNSSKKESLLFHIKPFYK